MLPAARKAIVSYAVSAVLPLAFSGAVIFYPAASHAEEELNVEDLLNLSLKELAEIEITSVSKKAEKETEAAAAIYVITQEDIRRSGATAIPELLRGVPGLTVTQAGSHDWTVAARGFNDQFSNKLLVLIDGRTVYSPLFSGVIWDMQDTVLEDIERIEVIRGPGATLCGANAVNGVINIITKKAGDTQGGYASFTAGNQVNGIGTARYGAKMGEDSYVRVYAKYSDYDAQATASGGDAQDDWNKMQAGFRSDSRLTASDDLTVQGDIYAVDEGAPFTYPDVNSGTLVSTADGRKGRGANLLMRWTQKQSEDSETSVQAYFDNAYLKTSFFLNETNTADLDFQHSWTGWEGQEVVWGLGYRLINDKNDMPSQQFSLSPRTRNDNLFNAFVQDKFEIIDDSVYLTLGSKFEHNDYTGFEVQPSARASWLVADNQTLWGSVSRAVHTPSRYTDDGNLSLGIDPVTANPLLILVANAGNRALESEELIAYELGYRIQPDKNLSFDVAAFYNDYSKLFQGTLGSATPVGGYLLLPIIADNSNAAQSYGLEISTEWAVNSEWQLSGTYSYISLKFDNKNDPAGNLFIGKNPRHMFDIRSHYTLSDRIQISNNLYYSHDIAPVNAPNYFRFDTKISYQLNDGVELSLIGQNLLDDRHKEFAPFLYGTAAEIRRSIYGNVSINF